MTPKHAASADVRGVIVNRRIHDLPSAAAHDAGQVRRRACDERVRLDQVRHARVENDRSAAAAGVDVGRVEIRAAAAVPGVISSNSRVRDVRSSEAAHDESTTVRRSVVVERSVFENDVPFSHCHAAAACRATVQFHLRPPAEEDARAAGKNASALPSFALVNPRGRHASRSVHV
eukprot:31079-Pelagococcus_subviridis.AAC.15